MSSSGKVVVITGGAQGIGLGIAKRFHSQDATIVLIDCNQAVLEKTATDGSIWNTRFPDHHAVDVTNAEQVQSCFDSIFSKHGRLDILVQAAGITGKTGIKTAEVDPADFDRVMAINVKGIFLCCRAVIPKMLANNFGRIINIASISGKDGNAGMLAYSTSKAAVIGLTKVIGKEYAETPITCNCIAPAVVQTAMVDAMPEEQVKYMTDKIPMKRTGKIEEIAALVSYIASEECSFTTAFCFDASGGRAVY